METTKFGMIHDNDIIESVHKITDSSYSMKKEIFKNMVRAKTLDKSVLKEYLAKVNGFLRFWDDYANDLQEKIKSSKGETGIYTVDYQFVKDYIYAKYDYASVLPFTDGLIKGISSGKFDSVDDIEDFRDHTINKAFHHSARSAAEMLDSVIVSGGGIGINTKKETDNLDAKCFDAIRSVNLFNRRDRAELYKAIATTLEFMTQDVGVGKYLTTDDMKITVAMVNNIVEYVTYSLAAYAARIYIISAYSYPFINRSTNAKTPISEATIVDGDRCEHVEVTVFRDANEMICRDPAKTKEFMDIFLKFITAIEADNLLDSPRPVYDKCWGNKDGTSNNAFCAKLMVNPLTKFIRSAPSIYGHTDSGTSMNELNGMIRELIYNSNQGIQGSTSPKQELFHVIRGTTCDNTIKGYQKLAADLYTFSFQLCCNTNEIIQCIINWKKSENEHPLYNTGTLNTGAETLKIMSEFYRDMSIAILQKARDIEMHINYFRVDELNKVTSGLSIKIPNEKPDIATNDNMMTAVPDTTRVPTDLLDMYDVPTFEYMELYNEYVKMLPGMEDDIFFSEAFSIADIFNKIISMIQNSWKRFKAFLDNKDVKNAMNWAINHEKDLMAMDFSNVTIDVLPYKEPLELPKNYNKLKTGLTNFDIKNFASKDAITAYAKSLYPSDTVYGWFTNDNEKQSTGAAKYRSYILFTDEASASEKTPEKRKLGGSALKNTIPLWIKTLKDADETFTAYKKMGDDIDAQIKNIRTKAAGSTSNTTQTTTTATSTSTSGQESDKQTPPSIENADNDTKNNNGTQTSTTQTQSQTQKPEEKKAEQNDTAALTSEGLTAVSVAIDRLYKSLSPMFVEYIKAEYAYLKEAYAYGSKTSQNN